MSGSQLAVSLLVSFLFLLGDAWFYVAAQERNVRAQSVGSWLGSGYYAYWKFGRKK